MFSIKNKFFLAPLAGYSDELFRFLARKHGADVTITEMVSVKGLIYRQKNTFDLLASHATDHPLGVQLFGYDAEDFARAAEIVLEKHKVEFFDINVGCPVKKVIKQKAGSYLMKEPKQVESIIKALVKNISLPISVKIRTGWDNKSKNYLSLAKLIEDSGAAFITVHGRTRTELFAGDVDYEAISQIKAALTIPVVGSGDIVDLDSFEKMRTTGCDSYMIGRAAIGQPWLFNEIKKIKEYSFKEKFNIMLEHFQLYEQKYGESLGIRKFRNFGVHYLKKMFHKKALLQKLFDIKTKEEMIDFFHQLVILQK